MKDIVIESPSTKRVTRLRAGHVSPEVMARCIIEVRVGGLESACCYLSSVGIWARVANFSNHGTFQLMPTGHWSDELVHKVAQS